MPPELAAAGFEATLWGDSRRFGAPARRVVRALFAVAKTEADVSLAVARAFKLANTPPHQARLSPGGQPTSRAASFGEARRVSVTVDGGSNSFRHLDLPLSASPLPPALSVLCVRDGRGSAAEVSHSFQKGG